MLVPIETIRFNFRTAFRAGGEIDAELLQIANAICRLGDTCSLSPAAFIAVANRPHRTRFPPSQGFGGSCCKSSEAA
jgi:hypothetical protein